MARLDADCVLALAPLKLKPAPRRFVTGLAFHARMLVSGRWAPALTARQSRWLYQLVVAHAREIRDAALVRDAQAMLERS